mmetsp:Transcript_10247/g.29255  ORF Transcript_10247/g.29255 Transcript_10247/m.29255 type:complete len:273 (+) Transcript_10247:652-1470(+)
MERPGMLVAMELGDKTLRDVVEERPTVNKQMRLERLALVVKMLRGLSQMHEQGFYHRDVKLENVILVCKNENSWSTCEPKLIDFGFACNFKVGNACDKWSCGTVEYEAPDGKADDVWAAAIVMRELFTGSKPFHIANGEPVLYSILHDTSLVSFHREFPEWFALMRAMLVQERKDRISMPEASRLAEELFEKTVGTEPRHGAQTLPSGYAKAVEGIKDLDTGFTMPVKAAERRAKRAARGICGGGLRCAVPRMQAELRLRRKQVRSTCLHFP